MLPILAFMAIFDCNVKLWELYFEQDLDHLNSNDVLVLLLLCKGIYSQLTL